MTSQQLVEPVEPQQFSEGWFLIVLCCGSISEHPFVTWAATIEPSWASE